MDARGYGNYSRPAVDGSFTMKVRLINKGTFLEPDSYRNALDNLPVTDRCFNNFETRDIRQLQQLHIENPYWFRSISI